MAPLSLLWLLSGCATYIEWGYQCSAELPEVWYDDRDQNCDGNDDDQDGDGVPFPVDCWDDPNDLRFLSEEVGAAQTLTAELVYPGAEDAWYDGVDANCDGADDFDQDGDGFQSANDWQADGSVGEDCVDGSPNDQVFEDRCTGEILTVHLADAATVNPDAEDPFYDGLDQNCDGSDDLDQDLDGFAYCHECDDLDPDVIPTDAADPWYDCEDQNCDGNDGDQDGDGFVRLVYMVTCPSWSSINPGKRGGDCADYSTNDGGLEPALNDLPDLATFEIYPSAEDIPYDGIDAACDGDLYEFDVDADGHDSGQHRDWEGQWGDDCDDNEPLTHPGQVEVCGDGADNDCAGDPLECSLQGTYGVTDAELLITSQGSTSATRLGFALASGDLDGDGYEDLTVGAHYTKNADEASFAGAAYVVYGPITAASPDKHLVLANDESFAAQGATTASYLGYDLSAGDLNGDAKDELVIGAPGANSSSGAKAGAVYLVMGGARRSGSLDAADMSGVIEGSGASDNFGTTVSVVEDMNGDRFQDLVIGASGSDSGGDDAGKLYVVLGARTLNAVQSVDQVAAFVVSGIAGDEVGKKGSTLRLGDLDGDGLADLAFGARVNYEATGVVYLVYSGGVTFSGAEISASAVDLTLSGALAGDALGAAVTSGGDLDGDGYDELLCGAPGVDRGDAGVGAVYVLSGGAPQRSGHLTLSTISSVEVFGDRSQDSLGVGLTTGDLDADGHIDLIAGATGHDGDKTNDGGVFLWYGPIDAGTYDTQDAAIELLGGSTGSTLGASNLTLDLNGDGFTDLLSGATADEELYGFLSAGL